MRAGNDWFADTYLILQYCIANIFDQTSKFVRILDVVDKAISLCSVGQ